MPEWHVGQLTEPLVFQRLGWWLRSVSHAREYWPLRIKTKLREKSSDSRGRAALCKTVILCQVTSHFFCTLPGVDGRSLLRDRQGQMGPTWTVRFFPSCIWPVPLMVPGGPKPHGELELGPTGASACSSSPTEDGSGPGHAYHSEAC